MRRYLRQHLTRYGLWYISGLAVLIFLIPLLIRGNIGAPITPGAQSYTLLRHADLVGYDHLNNEFIAPTPMSFLLSFMKQFDVPWILPILLSLIFIILLEKYLSRFIRRKKIVLFALAAFVFSPTMSIFGTHHSSLLLGLIFILCSILFLRIKYLALALAVITSPLISLFAFLYHLLISKRKPLKIILLIISLSAAICWFAFWSALPSISLEFRPFLFEFGVAQGISVFFFIVAGYGFLSNCFTQKREMVLILISLLMISFFIPDMIPVLTITLSVLTGYAIFDLLTSKWELDLLRQSLIVLIFCIGVFLSIVLIRERIDENPTTDFTLVMAQLSSERHPGAVLSRSEYAPLIEYFSGRKATLHEGDSMNRSLYSRDSETVYAFLEETDTSYIFITTEMLDTMFENSEQDILFLLPNTQRFIAVSRNQDSTMWYYIQR